MACRGRRHASPRPAEHRPMTTPPSDMEEYLFDLRGYSLLPAALGSEELRRLNESVDSLGCFDQMEPGQWLCDGRLECHSYYADGRITDGVNIQHMFEAGEEWEALIDHHSWVGRVKHYLGRASPIVHELFVNLRGPGGYIGCHCGGPAGMNYNPQYGAGIIAGRWGVQYLSLIVALEDIGPGDGATVLVPGSHKSEIAHPVQQMMTTEGSKVEGAVEMHMKAGDCLLFNDSCLHGAAARASDGQRRVICFRYLPSNYRYRWRYTCSEELWQRLTPARREIMAAVGPQRGGASGQQAYKL